MRFWWEVARFKPLYNRKPFKERSYLFLFYRIQEVTNTTFFLSVDMPSPDYENALTVNMHIFFSILHPLRKLNLDYLTELKF